MQFSRVRQRSDTNTWNSVFDHVVLPWLLHKACTSSHTINPIFIKETQRSISTTGSFSFHLLLSEEANLSPAGWYTGTKRVAAVPFLLQVMLWIKINTFTYPFETIWAWVLRYKSLLSWPITTRVIDYSSKTSVKWSAKGKCRNPSFAYQTWQVEGFTTVTVTVT